MPTEFQRPTIEAIIARVQADIEGALVGVSARLRARIEYFLARAISGAAHGLYGHQAWIAEQIIIDQAVTRYVVRFANLFGVDRKQASQAKRTLVVTGTGGDVEVGRRWVRVADGFTFTQDTALTGVTASNVGVTAILGGKVGNLQAGEKLRLESNIAGVDSEAVVSGDGGVDGTDLETIPALIERVIDRIQHPPMAGAPTDHEKWALEVAGVTRAWEYPRKDADGDPGLGKVALTFVCDDADDIIPSEDKVAEVQAYLDERSPAQVYVFAPTPVPYDYEVVLNPNLSSAVEDDAEEEVADMIRRDAVPGGTIYRSRFDEAVSTAAGEKSHATVSPEEDRTYSFGQLPVPGTPTFSPAA